MPTLGQSLLPPNKRLSGWIGFITSLFTPLTRDQSLLFTSYVQGSSASNWSSTGTYAYLQQVVYQDGCVYECQNVAGITSTKAPNIDITNWLKVQNTWVGARERAYYSWNLIFIEYILNKHFQVGTVTLPWNGASHSTQIFISNSSKTTGNFWLSDGTNGAINSYMGNTNTGQKYFIGNSYNALSQTSFTVNVPTAVDAAITANQPNYPSPSAPNAESVIRALLNNYILAGFTYKYQTY